MKVFEDVCQHHHFSSLGANNAHVHLLSAQVIVLNLVGVELNFNLVELKAVLTPFIQAVNLGKNPDLSGNLSTISDCVGLYDLCLEATGVEGDLSSLQKCKKLHKVLLSDLKITGDIAVFAPCRSLKKVWLRCTQVIYIFFRQNSFFQHFEEEGCEFLESLTPILQFPALSELPFRTNVRKNIHALLSALELVVCARAVSSFTSLTSSSCSLPGTR